MKYPTEFEYGENKRVVHIWFGSSAKQKEVDIDSGGCGCLTIAQGKGSDGVWRSPVLHVNPHRTYYVVQALEMAEVIKYATEQIMIPWAKGQESPLREVKRGQ